MCVIQMWVGAVWVYVCVSYREREMYTHTHIFVHECMCVYRERYTQIHRERGTHRYIERERDTHKYICTWVHVYVHTKNNMYKNTYVHTQKNHVHVHTRNICTQIHEHLCSSRYKKRP